MSSRTINPLTPIQRAAAAGVRDLMDRGYDRPAAVRFTLNRMGYAQEMGEEGDEFVARISRGSCSRVKNMIVIKEEGHA